MSEETEREAVELSNLGGVAFGDLMDALVTEEEGQAAEAAVGEGQKTPARDAAPDKSTADGGDEAAGRSTPTAGQETSGRTSGSGSPDSGTQGTAGGDTPEPAAASTAADLPADWTASPDDFIPKLGQLSTKLEESITKQYQQQAFNKAREEYERYFEALETHPRLLVGTEVPAIGQEGMETLRDTADAREWQEAVQALLAQEITEAAQENLRNDKSVLDTLHASIDLFKNNKDLIPGTRTFDRQLADEFAQVAQSYEIRDEKGNLRGYNVPVQPIIDSIREKLKVSRGAAASPPSSEASRAAAPAAAPSPEPPQAGIASKAGSSEEREDFSTLFGTIGLPHLQI